MPEKYLVEFLAKWLRDEDLRKKVLHRESTWLGSGPQNVGGGQELTTEQIQVLLGLDKRQILGRIQKEFEELGIDLDAARLDVWGQTPEDPAPEPSGGGIASSMVYGEGEVHIRGVTPQTIEDGVERHVVLRGQGFEENSDEDNIEVRFVHDDVPQPVKGDVIAFGCDVDIYQRVTVKVTLTEKGKWKVSARNAGGAWSETVDMYVVGVA